MKLAVLLLLGKRLLPYRLILDRIGLNRNSGRGRLVRGGVGDQKGFGYTRFSHEQLISFILNLQLLKIRLVYEADQFLDFA
ncbi:hypothetical protein D3C75_1023090 [compost metagenome]